MKKINFEKLGNDDLFLKFNTRKLDSYSNAVLRGGTSTTLCSTTHPLMDSDSEASQENPSDSRCYS